MESQLNPEKGGPNGSKKIKPAREAAEEAWEKISRSHEETPTPGLAQPEISPEFINQTREHLEELRGQLEARMADLEGTRNKSVIRKLKDEIKELETFVLKHSKKEIGRESVPIEEKSVDMAVSEFAEPKTTETKEKERKPTVRGLNLQIENLDQKLKETVSRRLETIRATDSTALKAVQKEILQRRDELTKLRAEREALLQKNIESTRERMREILAHAAAGKAEKERHTKLTESGITLEEIKEQELNKKDIERWNKLLELDAEQNRVTEDYKLLRSEYESLQPEAISSFLKSVKKETKTDNLDMSHAASQLLADIEAGRVAGFTETEAKFFTASAAEIQARTEAIESMPPEMTAEEAIHEWENIKKRSSKGESEARKEEEAFIDFLKKEYPDTITFTGKEYLAARAKPKKAGFFKKLFSFGKTKSDWEEMEEALDQVPHTSKLVGLFLKRRMERMKSQKPMSIKSR